jgi:hypothetical protein
MIFSTIPAVAVVELDELVEFVELKATVVVGGTQLGQAVGAVQTAPRPQVGIMPEEGTRLLLRQVQFSCVNSGSITGLHTRPEAAQRTAGLDSCTLQVVLRYVVIWHSTVECDCTDVERG